MELPEDMVAGILRRVHPLEAVRAKLVCKSWRRASSSLSMLPSALGFAIDCSSSSETLLYADLSCLKWLPLPLLAQPASLHASANSFLCLSTSSSAKSHLTQLHLLNPLTRAHVCIPHALFRLPPFLVGLCFNPNGHGFKVVTAGHKALAERSRPFDVDLELPVQVFDSECNSWHMAGSVPGAAPEYADPLCVGTRCYWLSRRSFRRHVLVFNAEDESWSMIDALLPPDLSPYTLWAWEGHLYMAAELSNDLTIWKLASDESEWLIHIRIAPEVINIEHFCGVKDVAGHGPLLCIMLVWARQGIVYDLRTRTVSRLPYCPVSSYSWGNVLPCMLGFTKLC
eukprot:c20054_g1_i1 orf=265-1284(-)